MSEYPRVILILLLILRLTTPARALAPADVTAVTAVLMDADTGQVLFDKNMYTHRAPASTTKVMTGMLVMESCAADELVTVSEAAVDILYNSSNVALTPDEELTVDSAMYALMLPSANDAANALAEHVSGSQKDFAALMNKRARELGALDTNFANPSGLPDDRHYTSAYDMALITRAAIDTPGFLKYFGTGRHTIPATNKQSEERPLTNQNFMLLPDQEWAYNPDVIGGKVGYTDEARHTMTSAATKNGRTLIAVVFGCGIDEKFDDTQLLFDYGFDSFKPIELPVPPETLASLTCPVTDGGETVGEAAFSLPGDSVSRLVPLDVSPSDITIESRLPDSVELGDSSGNAALLLSAPRTGGGPPVQIEIPLNMRIKLDPLPDAEDTVAQVADSGEAERSRTWIWIAAIIVIIIAVPFMWALVQRQKIKRRAARRRMRRERLIRELRDPLEPRE